MWDLLLEPEEESNEFPFLNASLEDIEPNLNEPIDPEAFDEIIASLQTDIQLEQIKKKQKVFRNKAEENKFLRERIEELENENYLLRHPNIEIEQLKDRIKNLEEINKILRDSLEIFRNATFSYNDKINWSKLAGKPIEV